MNYPRKYYKAIQNGEVSAPQTIKAIYERELNLMETRNLDFRFDEKAGLRPIEFIERFCKTSQGRLGAPLKLELFQKAKIQLAFGWLERDSRLRRFREIGDVRGRKCGKSTETAGIELYMLLADGEGAPEIYCVANKLDQAKRVFDEAVNMRAMSPEIKGITRKRQTDIYCPGNMGYIKAIASDTKTMDGLNAYFFSLDEWHEARDRGLYDKMKQSQYSRDEPLAWLISSAGFFREGFFDTQTAMYKDIATGAIENDRILPLLYQLDNRDEWLDPTCWEKANPGLGKIKKIETLMDCVRQAKIDPSFLPTVLTQDFNMPCTTNEAWLPFDAIVNETVVDMDYLKNSYAIGGCDLSATTDLTCATVLIRKPSDRNIYVLQHYFIPESRVSFLDKQGSKEAPYRLWARQGWLTICDGTQVNYSDVTKWFYGDMVKQYNIRPLWVCYDRAFAGYWVDEMIDHGFDMEKVAQGPFTWSQPMKEMGAAFEAQRVIYQNNPMLRWCLSNTAAKAKNLDGIATIQPVKIASNRRIDGMVSLLNAWVGYVKHFDEYMSYVK